MANTLQNDYMTVRPELVEGRSWFDTAHHERNQFILR